MPTKKKSTKEDISYWAYAIVNGRFANIWFSDVRGIYTHGYPPGGVPYLKSHKRMMERDLKTNVFSYRDHCYTNKITKKKYKINLKYEAKLRKERDKEVRDFFRKKKEQDKK